MFTSDKLYDQLTDIAGLDQICPGPSFAASSHCKDSGVTIQDHEEVRVGFPEQRTQTKYLRGEGKGEGLKGGQNEEWRKLHQETN